MNKNHVPQSRPSTRMAPAFPSQHSPSHFEYAASSAPIDTDLTGRILRIGHSFNFK